MAGPQGQVPGCDIILACSSVDEPSYKLKLLTDWAVSNLTSVLVKAVLHGGLGIWVCPDLFRDITTPF